MAISLFKQTSLPIELLSTQGKLAFKDKILQEKVITDEYSLEQLKPTLVNPLVNLPEHIYTEYRHVEQSLEKKRSSGIYQNFLILPPQMIGIEFCKTHIYTSPFLAKNWKARVKKIAYMLTCVQGSCIVTLQIRKPREEWIEENKPEIFECGLAKLTKGEKLPIFAGYDYVVHNIKSQPTVLSKVYMKNFKLNYADWEDYKGFSYYIIRKNGRTEVVPNSRYKNLPKMKVIKVKDLMAKYELSVKDSIENSVEKIKKYLV